MGLPIPYFNFPNEPRSFGADQIDREKPVPDAGADNLHPIGQNEGALEAAGGADSFGGAIEKPLVTASSIWREPEFRSGQAAGQAWLPHRHRNS